MNDKKNMNQTGNMENAEKIRSVKRRGKKSGRRRKRQIRKLALIVLVLAAVVLISALILQKKVYHKYDVLSSAKNEDVQSSGYIQMGDCLLKYAADGAALMNQKEETLWKQNYDMTNPVADVQEETAVVADKEGTLMHIFKKNAPVGAVETDKPILKVRVSSSGMVAAILEDGEKTWVNFYAADGSLIAENQTRIDSPGYPVDLSVSPDGKLLMISYVYVENGQTTSYVAFYNFGDAGQGAIDNIVAGFTYEGIMVPQVSYLRDGVSVAFRDNGFSIYEGGSIPKEAVNKKIKTDVISTFYSDKYIGLVFKSEKEDAKYTMQVYDISGKEQFSKDFNIEYKNIKISGDMIILSNDSQVNMYSLNGGEKFNGSIDEGAIKDLFKVGRNRYFLVSENGIKTIKLK